MRRQLASAHSAAEAAKAQLQAFSIAAEQQRSAIQKELADLGVRPLPVSFNCGWHYIVCLARIHNVVAAEHSLHQAE